LDKLPTAKLAAYESQLLDYLSKNHPAISKTITEKKAIDDETKGKLLEALKAFEKVFT
jgi:F0F1-type ATP synthase alpha subunit